MWRDFRFAARSLRKASGFTATCVLTLAVGVGTLEHSVSDAIAQPRFRSVVFGALSTIAVVLAALGLAGLIAYSISQRTAEIGIRMALGASTDDILRMIVGEASILSLTGIGVGIVVAFASARVLRSLLYQVGPDDPVSFVTASVALFGIALAAAYVPARRVTCIDPATALKAE
jgi:putative ABC transport system permease protein